MDVLFAHRLLLGARAVLLGARQGHGLACVVKPRGADKALRHQLLRARQFALGRLQQALAAVAEAAAANEVTYCLEPLSAHETPVVNTVAQAAALVRAVGHPNLRTMIDCSAAGLGENEPVADLIERWLPTGLISHIQVNDPNRRGPGQGEMPFAPILATLRRHGYRGAIAVEPFDYVVDGPTTAAFCIGYLKGLREALA